jgi:hypothetical protein
MKDPRRYYREIVRLCLVAIVCFAVGILLMLSGWADFPAWWYWSILLWVAIPEYLMQLDSRKATGLSRADREKWERALVSYGVGRFVVPFFYFLADRNPGHRSG